LHEKVEKSDLKEAMEKADIMLLLVDHKEFKRMDRSLLNGKVAIDTRGCWL